MKLIMASSETMIESSSQVPPRKPALLLNEGLENCVERNENSSSLIIYHIINFRRKVNEKNHPAFYHCIVYIFCSCL